MSVTGIASTILSGLSGYQHRGQSKVQQLAGEFKQLAQDVQSGNLTQAQQTHNFGSEYSGRDPGEHFGRIGGQRSIWRGDSSDWHSEQHQPAHSGI